MSVLLLGGSSHAGKSTVGRALAERLGGLLVSTDQLARHPGRPWKTPQRDVPAHVAEHYATLTTPELFADVLAHYRRVWVDVAALIAAHNSDPAAGWLVIEGSALWPEFAATLEPPPGSAPGGVAAIWLTTRDELFRRRIYAESHFAQVDPAERLLIEKFLDRTLYFNRQMMAAIRRLGLTHLEVGEDNTPKEVTERCLGLLARWNS